MNDLNNSVIFPKGQRSDPRYFIGDSWAYTLVADERIFNCPIWNVTFAPSARNNWHKHPGGQILLVTGGNGYYQEEGKAPQKLQVGDVVQIPSGVKHWHGATQERWFTHIAICTNPQNGGAEWLEPVSDEEYSRLR